MSKKRSECRKTIRIFKKRIRRFRKNRVLIEFERGDPCPKKDQNTEK